MTAKRRDYLRASFFLALTDLFPPLVKEAILTDDSVTGQFALSSDGILTFGPSNTAFLRSKVFSVIREALTAGGEPKMVIDETGKSWAVRYEAEPTPRISIQSDAGTFFGSHLALLADNASIRMGAFRVEVSRVNLPAAAEERWAAILRGRALTDDEMGEFVADINTTPVVASSAIADHLARANVSIDVLVPKSLSYYERLVGKESGQADLQAYINEVMGEHMASLLRWNQSEGLRQCLLLGAHSLVASKLASLEIDAPSASALADWIAEKADPISQGLYLEFCILNGAVGESATKELASVSQALGVDADGSEVTPYTILSTAFVAVYGELSQARTIISKPIYWRRLAAMAQASLIVRHVLASQLKLEGFIEWLRGLRGNNYLAQIYADLREAPLWQPQFALPYQLRNEIAGRVVMRAASSPEVVEKLGLTDSLTADTPESLKGRINLLLAQMPGPLEGDIALVRPIPEDEFPKVRDPLLSREVTVQSYVPLVNSALLFVIPAELAELAAEAIRRSQFQIESGGDGRAFESCLIGLATAASVTRHVPLADAIFSVLRYYRRYATTQLNVDEALRVGMIACASRSELSEWCSAVGRLVSELSFQELSGQDAAGLHAFVVNLCGIIPEMWAACGPGIAALEAVAA